MQTNEIVSALYSGVAEIGKRAGMLLQCERLFLEATPDYIVINYHSYNTPGAWETAAAKRIARFICKHFAGLIFFGGNIIARDGKLRK